jgi:hypothetical protein
MNWHLTLKTVYRKLEENGYGAIADHLHQEQLKGGTGGEIFGIVLTELLSIRDTRPEIHKLIETEVNSFIQFAKSIGYLH